MTLGVPCGVLGVLGAILRQMLPDNLEQWRIDQDPSVPVVNSGVTRMCALDDAAVAAWRLMDQMPTEGLPPGIPWISQPVERRLVLQHLPEVRIVIESMQRELQLARQRLPQRRLASQAPVIKICCSALLCITLLPSPQRPSHASDHPGSW